MSRTMRHKNRDKLSEFWRRVETGTDRGARKRQKRLVRLLDGAVRALPGNAASSPVRPQAGRR